MFKRILVTIDSGKAATLALAKAMELAKEQKAKLCIVHVLDYSVLNTGGEGVNIVALRVEYIKAAQKVLQQSITKAKQKKLKAEAILVESNDLIGNVSNSIVKAAKKWRANLIVMGTHAKSGVDRFLFGSTAEEVIRKSNIPVLMYRCKARN